MFNYQAIVEKIIEDGRHGPYAVATVENLGIVTFSLNLPVWGEASWPERGTYVLLSMLTKKRAGWRSGSARFFNPADEIKESKENRV